MTQPSRIAHLRATPRRAAVTMIAVIALLLAACSSAGSGGTSTAPSSAPSTAPSTVPSTAPASQGATGAVTIQLASSPLGQIMTDQDGNTIYVFTNDSANTSSCTDTCLDNWPPLTVGDGESASAGTGVTATLGTITRDDGRTQVTVNQQPVYYFAGDTAAGDVNGQNVGGKWFVVNPDGSLNQGSAAAATTTSYGRDGY